MSELPPSPSRTTVALVPPSEHAEWQPILHASNQVVLYNPKSHALTIGHSANYSSVVATRTTRACPYCKQTIPLSVEQELLDQDLMDHTGVAHDDVIDLDDDNDPDHHSRVGNYFQILAVSNDVISRPVSPSIFADDETTGASLGDTPTSSTFPAENMAEGYFNRFFQEEYKLGMGANGSVFLCQVRRPKFFTPPAYLQFGCP